MTNNNQNTPALEAMSFYHPHGMVPAWKNAADFGGANGRVATLSDIIAARLGTKAAPSSFAWDNHFTTATAEYVGISASGRKVIIVAHGVGPMATIEGVLKAYSWEYKDKERNRRGGRITQEEFLKLEAGHYGPVSVVDMEELVGRYKYALYEVLTESQAIAEPLMKARLGANYKQYLRKHAVACREYQEGNYKRKDPHIIRMESSSNCSYLYKQIEPGYALAHLLSITQAQGLGHSSGNESYSSLVSAISCHDWTDGVRLAGVRSATGPSDIHGGLRGLDRAIKSHLPLLLKPVSETPDVGLRPLCRYGERWFAQYLKQGAGMDTGAPEYVVTSMQKVEGGPSYLTTRSNGMHFIYDIKEVARIAPVGANAYHLPGPIGFGEEGHVAPIVFYRVELDVTSRVRKEAEIYDDFALLLKLVA